MSGNVHDTPCVNNKDSDENERTCDWCASMLDYRPAEGWHTPLSDAEHEEAIRLFGGPSLTSRKRWSHFSNRLKNSMFANWAKLPGGEDPVDHFPCSPEQFDELVQDCIKGRDLNAQQRRWLNQGVQLKDGLWLRYMGDEWYLNDVGLGRHLHLNTVLDVVGHESVRQGWNLAKLLTGLSALHVSPPDEEAQDAHHFLFRGRYHRLIDPHHRPIGLMLTWLALDVRVQSSTDGRPKGAKSGLAWAYDFKASTTDVVRRTHPQRLVEEAFSNRPAGLFEGRREPWMSLWDESVSTKEEVDNLDYPLVTGGRKLKMRVRTHRNKSRLVQIPNQPDIWAILLSWAFSPLMSKPGKLLLGVQHNWSRAYFKRGETSPEVVRSLQFCHSILNGLSGARLALEHDRVLVIGNLGHVYEVRVGDGQHGAPYRIRHMLHFQRGSGHELCIHSGAHARSLPIGDTLGSVLLSLYNDTTAMHRIDSLAGLVCQSPPFGFPEHLDDRWRGLLSPDAVQEVMNATRSGGMFMRMNAREPPWYLCQHARPVVGAVEGDEGGGHLPHRMNRFRRLRSRGSVAPWVERFQAAVEAGEGLPYDQVVSEWRRSVHPYNRHVAYQRRHLWERGLPRNRLNLRRAMGIAHRHNGDRHEIGDQRDGERRWCEVFARAWDLLLHQPIGSWVNVPTSNNGTVTFEHADLRFSIRSSLERRFLRQMTRWCGYVEDGEEAGFLRFRRRDHPLSNARMRLCEALGKLQQQQGVRGAPPRWWNYVEPYAPPNEMEQLRWPFHEDLCDAPPPQRSHADDPGFDPIIEQVRFE